MLCFRRMHGCKQEALQGTAESFSSMRDEEKSAETGSCSQHGIVEAQTAYLDFLKIHHSPLSLLVLWASLHTVVFLNHWKKSEMF